MTVRSAFVAVALAMSGILTAAQTPPQTASPAPVGTEIFLAPFKDGNGKTIRLGFLAIQKRGFSPGKPLNITNSPGETDRWIETADLRKAGVTGISRVAVSPDGKWIAIVATPAAK